MKPAKQKKSSSRFGGFFDLPEKKYELQELDDQINADPNFWDNPTESAKVLRKKKALEQAIEQAKRLEELNGDLKAAIELSEEGEEFRLEAEALLVEFQTDLTNIETQTLLSGELDDSDSVITINAGAGGTESCDWAEMLFRMYLRYSEKQGFKTEIFDIQEGDEAGIKNVTFGVNGSYSFGLLSAESGVHRLVRISPFDSNARRHTSFSSVFVTPVIDDSIEIEINESDLRVDTYRASGAGGQHINKTDSAVRMTHNPTGIVVQCQTQRSQHQNREQCLKLLKGKLYELEIEERKKKQQDAEGEKSEIGWGSQIRSYVLHPYKMVKDHRTSMESHNPDAVLDGDISGFIHSFLSKKANQKTQS